MRIVIFGATGRTGRLVVDEVLARGHEAVAFVRTPEKLGPAREGLTILAGGIDDKERIAAALDGAGCVISAMGSGEMTLTVLAQSLVPVMRDTGPRRIVTLCGAGMEMQGDPQTFGRRFFLTMMSLGGSMLIADMRRHWALLDGAQLDWTLVRPPRMSNGPATGKLKHGPKIVVGMMDSISRADLARFMVDVALDGLYIRESPFVAKA